jgi:hypothetical protein
MAKAKKEPKQHEFQKENQLWKQRTKHGRDAIFGEPVILWEAAIEYFKWVDENPLYVAEWKDGDLQSIPKKRPYTWGALCIYLGVAHAYFRNFKTTAACTDDFLTVIAQIDTVIYEQKFEGAAADQFNANIISRDLGLADKKEVQANVNLHDRPIEFE